jgi:hypothetical protein
VKLNWSGFQARGPVFNSQSVKDRVEIMVRGDFAKEVDHGCLRKFCFVAERRLNLARPFKAGIAKKS